MQQLNQRQQKILDFLSENKFAGNADIVAFLGDEVTRFTILRDLKLLLEEGLIKKSGKGKAVKYELFSANPILSHFDPDKYFKKGPDERILKSDSFNQEIFGYLVDIFSKEEIEELYRINYKYVRGVSGMEESRFKKEVERMNIEFSWKSSQIEGNTYSLIDTEILIKERIEAEGHKKEEAIMILNHKNAIDYIFENKDDFKKLDLFHIEKIHDLLVRGLNVQSGIRHGKVRITGTRYNPVTDKAQIINYLHKIIDKVNSFDDPFSKALTAILMISYLQPFFDGNKRTARILGNAILLANNACPLSYRSVSETDYKKATLLFYEQNSARFFKDLFIEQFKFAIDNYF
ncbi:MAG: Fic family protein [Candidatus Pacebacteria bacterium]|nr:Fic family protein [Candidatus Paceibacterota bacterium]